MLAIELPAEQHAASPHDLDAATIERWLWHHDAHMNHRALAAKHDAALIAMGSEYAAAVKREQQRWDEEHAAAEELVVIDGPHPNGYEGG